jgi:hypothetical protein
MDPKAELVSSQLQQFAYVMLLLGCYRTLNWGILQQHNVHTNFRENLKPFKS